MNCSFCASGRLKMIRGLTTSEMVRELLTVESLIKSRISSVVLMGIGEPFDNYDNVIKFVNLLINPKGISIAQRKVTISTCGIVPKIYEFADIKNQVNLAISLHAADDEKRNKLMPINNVYNIQKLFEAVDYYIGKTNRRVTIEYIMLAGINDSEKCALELAKLVKGKLMYVNLIPYNETSNLSMKRSNDFQIKCFYDILKMNNVNVTIRKEFGGNVSAACGQLRAEDAMNHGKAGESANE